MKAILLPTLQGTSFMGPKSRFKSIFNAEKLIKNKKSIFDAEKSIISWFWTQKSI